MHDLMQEEHRVSLQSVEQANAGTLAEDAQQGQPQPDAEEPPQPQGQS